MSTITRERAELKSFITGFLTDPMHDDQSSSSMTAEVFRIALASLEAEPVAWDYEWASCITCEGPQDFKLIIEHEAPPEWAIHEGQARNLIPLYAAPPAPVMPDEAINRAVDEIMASYAGSADECRKLVRKHIEDACRAAMLQGAENAETPTTMQTAPALDSSPKIAESPTGINQGKSEPVTTAYKLRDAVETIRNSGIAIDGEKILAERDALNAPECWCHTCRPVTFADSRFVVCPDYGNKRCPHANDHRNACTGSNEPGQEGSAYPAAPQQETK